VRFLRQHARSQDMVVLREGVTQVGVFDTGNGRRKAGRSVVHGEDGVYSNGEFMRVGVT